MRRRSAGIAVHVAVVAAGGQAVACAYGPPGVQSWYERATLPALSVALEVATRLCRRLSPPAGPSLATGSTAAAFPRSTQRDAAGSCYRNIGKFLELQMQVQRTAEPTGDSHPLPPWTQYGSTTGSACFCSDIRCAHSSRCQFPSAAPAAAPGTPSGRRELIASQTPPFLSSVG